MSAKWIRSQQWDRQHLTGALTPVRWLLHLFSTVRFAIFLLMLLGIFGILASVPIGIIAAFPTWGFYGLTLLLVLWFVAAVPVWLGNRVLRKRGTSLGVRFTLALVASLALVAMGSWLWYHYLWPMMRYDRVAGTGVMFFSEFVQKNWSTTVRRLPGMEMSELEFYAWWPLNLILILFVINMTIATVRRIEFVFENLGVLTVHTGIVLIGLGSAYYSGLKVEGDTLLMAGPPDPATGKITPGTPVGGFFDNTRTVVRVRQIGRRESESRFEQRVLEGVPRYQDYNLLAGEPEPTPQKLDAARALDQGRTLSIPLPGRPLSAGGLVDEDIAMRVIGYASYADFKPIWRRSALIPTDERLRSPVRNVELWSSVNSSAKPEAGAEMKKAASFTLLPDDPTRRVVALGSAMQIELTRGMSPSRWRELTANLPENAAHAIIVEIPGQKLSRIYPVTPGQKIELGEPKWTLEVKSISPTPPFPIITPGYENAQSSVAIVRVTPPADASGKSQPFERYLYHRFPELAQDLLDETNANGMPKRRAAESSIVLSYLDASVVQAYIDERPNAKPRAIVRVPGRAPAVIESLDDSTSIPIGPAVALKLGEFWPHAEQVMLPDPVPPVERTDKDAIGTHKRAGVAVEVSVRPKSPSEKPFSTVVWSPFAQYFDAGGSQAVPVLLPDGRVLEIGFGRLYRHLPDNMQLQLVDFEMIPYPHSQQPRDYRSDLAVYRMVDGQFQSSPHYTSLNDPLKVAPFVWSDNRNWFSNALGWFGSVMGPTQFKFSQSGWDNSGWSQSRAQAEQGALKRPYARFTILGVGNNPGIYVIAFGAILMGVGTPWAFYVKPWLLRRRKIKIQNQLRAEGKLPTKPRTAQVPAEVLK